MSKRSSAKYKLDRRMGENVFGRPKSPVNKREDVPGPRPRLKSKVSDVVLQLRASRAQGLCTATSPKSSPPELLSSLPPL